MDGNSPTTDEEVQRRKFVKAHPLFQKVSPSSAAFKNFLKQVRLRRYRRGEEIYTPGQAPAGIFLVRDGEVHLERRHHETGQTEVVAIEGRGSIFGEVSFLSGELHSSRARAALESSVYEIPGPAFLELLQSQSSVGEALSQLLSRRMRGFLAGGQRETPATVITLLYPENSRRGSRVAHFLGESLVDANPGPVLVCGFGQDSIFWDEPGQNLIGIMENWSTFSIDEIRDRIGSRTRPFDVIKGDMLYKPEARFERLGENIPGLLGRLRKYYSVILVEAGGSFAHPVISRIIASSDYILMMRSVTQRGRTGTLEDEHWRYATRFCTGLLEDFFDRVVTVSDEGPGTTLEELNRVINRNSTLYRNHIRLQNAVPLSAGSPAAEGHVSRLFLRGLGRIARKLSGASRGIVLGGGGARAFAHLGVLEVLEEEGIDFDMIAGTSMGAIVGASHALGRDTEETFRLLGEILPNSKAVLDKTLPLIGFFRGHKLSQAILRGFGDRRFEETAIPFFCNASALDRGRTLVFDQGYLATALRASVSLPGIFPPVRIGGFTAVDGGVLNNLPGEILRDRGCDHVIGVNVTPLDDDKSTRLRPDWKLGPWRGLIDYLSFPPILKIIYRSITMEGRELMRLRINDFDLVLHPDVGDIDIFDFDRLPEIVERGRAAARDRLEQIREGLIHKLG